MAMNYRKESFMRDKEEIEKNIKDITDLYGGAERKIKEKGNSEDGEIIKNIKLAKLQESKLNRFRPITGDEWNEFVSSIISHGILTPITVRPIDDDNYEILAGHNRVRGAKEAGLNEVPAIIKNVDDVEASYIIADTNLQREEVTDLEKGWAYRNIFEAINRNGKNQYNQKIALSHDGTKQDKEALGQSDPMQNISEESGLGQNAPMLRSSEIIAEKYGIGEKTVRRKIRLTYLIHPLYTCYEEKLITQEIAEQLSYLRNNEQALIEGLLHEGMEIDKETAKDIRDESEKREINDIDMKNIAGSNVKHKEPKVRIKRYRIDETLFPKNIKKGLREEYLIKALTYILENGIEV